VSIALGSSVTPPNDARRACPRHAEGGPVVGRTPDDWQRALTVLFPA
jgi:hypothetical protein